MGAVLSTLLAYVPTSKLAAAFSFLRDAVVRQFRNDFLAGGLVMAVAGVLSNACWRLMWMLRDTIYSRLFTTVEVPASSASYPPLLRWLQSQPAAWDSSKLYVQRTRAAAVTLAPHADSGGGEDDNASFLDRFNFVPAENSSVRLWYRGRLLWITGATSESNDGNGRSQFMRMPGVRGQKRTRVRRGNTSSVGFAGSYHITIFGRDKSVITQLLHEGQRLRKAEANLMTEVYAVSSSLPFKGGTKVGWYKVGSRPCRSIDSVILEGNRAKDILADCREFMGSEKWFAERGIPYRRGYLLEGKPGTGKTSLITALAGDLRLPVYMLSLSSPGMTDDTLLSLFHASDPSSLLLLEDIDAAFAGPSGAGQRTMVHAGAGRRRARRTPRGDDDDDDDDDEPDVEPGPPTLTFAGLLNAIDGVVAQQGRLLFMTTNHMERLDPALIRSGRVDYIMNFDLATQDQAQRLFTRFFESEKSTDLHDPSPTDAPDDDDAALGPELDPDADPRRQLYLQRLSKLAERFGRAVPPRKKSMADLQGFLMRYRKRPREALAHAHELRSDRTAASSAGPTVAGTAALMSGAPPPPSMGRSVSAPSARVSEQGYGIVGPAVDLANTPHVGAAAAAFRPAPESRGSAGRDTQRGGAGAGAGAGARAGGKAGGHGSRGNRGGAAPRQKPSRGQAGPKRKGKRTAGGAGASSTQSQGGGSRRRSPPGTRSGEDEMEAIWSSLAASSADGARAAGVGSTAASHGGAAPPAVATGATGAAGAGGPPSSSSSKTVGASPARSLGSWIDVPDGSSSGASAVSSAPATSPPRVADTAPGPTQPPHPSPKPTTAAVATAAAGAPAKSLNKPRRGTRK